METDIDRLHKYHLDKPDSRRVGHTFAACHEVVSAVELNAFLIVCVIPAHHYLDFIVPMLFNILCKRGFKFPVYERLSGSIRVAGTRIRFLIKDNDKDWRGLGEYILVNMTR